MGSSLCKGEKNRQIEIELQRERLEERKIVKILLLGSGDSGKSTIVKQMRYMLHTNYIGSFYYIAKGISQLQIDVPSQERDLISKFLTYSCVNSACQHLTEFYVPDNTPYLLAESSRILTPEYSPTEADVIHARASTTGVHEIFFSFRRFGIRLIDVGGQKTERRKWIHCFDNVSAILYVISLSCYDQFLEEDPSINRMDDSIELFRAMFYNQFLFKVKEPESNRHIYAHVTNATDTKNIEYFFIFMHQRNIFKIRPPNHEELAKKYPQLRNKCFVGANGKICIDFSCTEAVRSFTEILLSEYFELNVSIPKGVLVPRVPQRLNYLLLVEDLINLNGLREEEIVGIDI
uniref:Uncharacterized protein n=1 Tax=Meloidogyne javanica TaxID=6303 RepID=A0A915LLW3_MELJA